MSHACDAAFVINYQPPIQCQRALNHPGAHRAEGDAPPNGWWQLEWTPPTIPVPFTEARS